jgi:ribosomal-protein-alanine N-acetyltransferase
MRQNSNSCDNNAVHQLDISLKKVSQYQADTYIDDIMPVMHLSFESKYGEAWNIEQLRSMLNMPYIDVLMAYAENGQCAGFAITRTIAEEAEIMLIAIAPEFQRKSVGGQMLEHIISTSRNGGVKQIFLEVRSNNGALDFYRKYGFSQIGCRKNYYKGSENNRYDALTLLKTLLPDT